MKKLIFFISLLGLFVASSCSKDKDSEDESNNGKTASNWEAPQAEKYEYNMTYVAKIAFNNVVDNDQATEIAAFCGEELRGFTKLRYEEKLQAYICMMSIYSNQASGEAITIKVYNARKKRLFEKCDEFTFQNNGTIGSTAKIVNCNDLPEE